MTVNPLDLCVGCCEPFEPPTNRTDLPGGSCLGYCSVECYEGSEVREALNPLKIVVDPVMHINSEGNTSMSVTFQFPDGSTETMTIACGKTSKPS